MRLVASVCCSTLGVMWDVDLREIAAGLAGKVRDTRVSVVDWVLLAVGVLVLVIVLVLV
jgi:hypothetical protein